MSSYPSPLLVPGSGAPQLLERVPLTGAEAKAAYDEDWLQALLFGHPQCLPVRDLDSSIAELVPLCRELEEDEDLEADEPEQEAENERAKALNAFWTAFLADLQLDRADQPIGSPAIGGNQFFRLPTGRNAWISAYVARSTDQAGVYLALSKSGIVDRLYQALLQDRSAIDHDLGIPVEWTSNGKQYLIATTEKFPGPLL